MKQLIIAALIPMSFALAGDLKPLEIIGIRTAKPIKTFSQADAAMQIGSISTEEFSSWKNIQVLAEKDSYLKIKTPNGNIVWILSEKVEIKRSATCAKSAGTYVSTEKTSTNAARGIGESCN